MPQQKEKMAAFEVTAATLREKAQELQGLNERFGRAVDSLEASQKKLASTWEGDAKDAFDSAFAADKSKFALFEATVTEYVNQLQEIISGYEQAEAKNVSVAGTRTA